MFLGVIAPPKLDKEFDGKILLKRVSKREELGQKTYNQRFHDDFVINNNIKRKEWRRLYSPFINDNIDLLFQAITEEYHLEDHVSARLVLTYRTFSKTKKTVRSIRIRRGDGKILGRRKITPLRGMKRPLTLTDLNLHVGYNKGELVEKDITCDSDFMMSTIREIGTHIRSKMVFARDHPIYLFMDNAGGHGKTEIKKEYERILKDEYNVIIKWQCPNSPETNLLDLGIWWSIQSVVETVHRTKRMNADVLTKSVFKAWEMFEPTKITSIYNRWKKVLTLIQAAEGGNELVEHNRGKTDTSASLPKIERHLDHTDVMTADEIAEANNDVFEDDDGGTHTNNLQPEAI